MIKCNTNCGKYFNWHELQKHATVKSGLVTALLSINYHGSWSFYYSSLWRWIIDWLMSLFCSHKVIIHSIVFCLLILAWSLVSTLQGEFSLYYRAVSDTNLSCFDLIWQINLRWCFPTMAFCLWIQSCVIHNISSFSREFSAFWNSAVDALLLFSWS